MKKPRVLLLTASYGHGHNTAAYSLRDALEKQGAEAEVCDFFESEYPWLHPKVRWAYNQAIINFPWLWKIIYTLYDHSQWFCNEIGDLKVLRGGLGPFIKEYKPDVICSTHMLYNYSLNTLYPDHEKKPFHQATVITDSLTINRVWYGTYSDSWYVTNSATKENLERKGVHSEDLFDLGFPVSLEFDQMAHGGGIQYKRGDQPRILYVVNSTGIDSLAVARHILKKTDYQLTVTVGKNRRLNAEMKEEFAADIETGRMTLLGWTDQIPQLMMDHHVVISKAGGATTQEAIAAHTPMLVTHIVPGQEEGNYLLLEKNRAGAYTPSAESIISCLDKLFDDDGKLYEEYLNHIQKLATPQAAHQIAKHLINQVHET